MRAHIIVQFKNKNILRDTVNVLSFKFDNRGIHSNIKKVTTRSWHCSSANNRKFDILSLDQKDKTNGALTLY